MGEIITMTMKRKIWNYTSFTMKFLYATKEKKTFIWLTKTMNTNNKNFNYNINLKEIAKIFTQGTN
jgi:hypothetical protein